VEEALAKGRSEGTHVAMDRIEQAEAAHAEGERTLASAIARTAEAETRADRAEKMCGEARIGAATGADSYTQDRYPVLRYPDTQMLKYPGTQVPSDAQIHIDA
jgi:hypothetical protein